MPCFWDEKIMKVWNASIQGCTHQLRFQGLRIQKDNQVLTQPLFCNVTTNAQCWKPKYQLLSILMNHDQWHQVARLAFVSALFLPCFHELRNDWHSIQLCIDNPASLKVQITYTPRPANIHYKNKVRLCRIYLKPETIISLLFGNSPSMGLIHSFWISDSTQ